MLELKSVICKINILMTNRTITSLFTLSCLNCLEASCESNESLI